VTVLTPAARRLLTRAKARQLAPPGAIDRVHAAIARALSVGAEAELREPVRAHAKASRAWLPPVLGSCVVIVGMAVTLVFRAQSPSPAPPIAPPTNSVALPPSAAEPAAVSAPSAPETPELLPRLHVPSQRERDDDLRAEMLLLGRAERALRSGDLAGALNATRAHHGRFPRGQLRSEREGLQLIASCRLERDVSTALAHYLRSEPHSVLALRVREACARQLP
jgi:hypothetical protein